MKKLSIFLMILTLVVQGCSTAILTPSGTLQATLEPASVPSAESVLEEIPTLIEIPVIESKPVPEETVSAQGLRIFYLRDGNLWSWTEAGGIVQLTDTGDMSTIRVSANGQLLAFMRGGEVWTVRIDGTDARLISTQVEGGGSLLFAPNSVLLAVSTSDHIDVFDLKTNAKTTVTTYPALPVGYFPEIVWMPDSFGFKTIISSPVESGQAEMLFIFNDGTVASLAKFALVHPSESPLYFSPDGGYVIYVAKARNDKESLYLMDSSGATRPYGEPADKIRAYGWLPDSKRFVFGEVKTQQASIGRVDGPPAVNDIKFSAPTRWMENENYITIQNGDLILGNLTGGNLLIDSGVTNFDFLSLK